MVVRLRRVLRVGKEGVGFAGGNGWGRSTQYLVTLPCCVKIFTNLTRARFTSFMLIVLVGSKPSMLYRVCAGILYTAQLVLSSINSVCRQISMYRGLFGENLLRDPVPYVRPPIFVVSGRCVCARVCLCVYVCQGMYVCQGLCVGRSTKLQYN